MSNHALSSIIRDAASKPDIESAICYALRKWERHPEYQDWVSDLVRKALLQMIHGERHVTNVELRRAHGMYGAPSKVGQSTAVAAAAEMSLLDSYSIFGKRLGDFRGDELPGFIKSCLNQADGYKFNANLLARIKPFVANDKTVRECVSETKVKKLFAELKGKVA